MRSSTPAWYNSFRMGLHASPPRYKQGNGHSAHSSTPAWYSSFRMGLYTTPTTGRLPIVRPMDTHEKGKRCTKLVVPAAGGNKVGWHIQRQPSQGEGHAVHKVGGACGRAWLGSSVSKPPVSKPPTPSFCLADPPHLAARASTCSAAETWQLKICSQDLLLQLCCYIGAATTLQPATHRPLGQPSRWAHPSGRL